MIYRVSDFLASYDSAPRPPHLRPGLFSKLFLILSLPVRRRSSLLRGGGMEGGGAKSYEGEKAFLSLKHSIFSGPGEKHKKIQQIYL
jgi:hypothetical protein